MSQPATDGELIAAAEKALARYERRLGADFWNRIGGDRDDALQYAAIRCWKASLRHDSSAPMASWLFQNAKFGLSDYIRERRADLAKRSPARVVRAGLDDVAVEWKFDEVDIDDEELYEQPIAESEVPGSDLEADEERAKIRAMLDIALVGALEDRERRAVRLYYGLDPGAEHNDFWVAKKLRVSKLEAMELRHNALNKLRAEFRANEILGL